MDITTKNDIQKLAEKRKKVPSLDGAKKPEPKLSATGFGPTAVPGGSGIASPLVETVYADRTYFSTFTMTSSDGLFVLELKRVNTMDFVDANGKPLTIEFKDNV